MQEMLEEIILGAFARLDAISELGCCVMRAKHQAALFCSGVAVMTGASIAQIAHACVQQVHGLVFPLFRRLVTAKLLLRPLLPSQCRVQPMRHIGMLLPFR